MWLNWFQHGRVWIDYGLSLPPVQSSPGSKADHLVPKIFKKFQGKGKYVEKNMFAVVRYSLFQILVVLDTTFDWPRLLVGITFYSPHGTSWKHIPWHSQQQLESTIWINLLLNLKEKGQRKSHQFMFAHKLVPRHLRHWALTQMAKTLSFHKYMKKLHYWRIFTKTFTITICYMQIENTEFKDNYKFDKNVNVVINE